MIGSYIKRQQLEQEQTKIRLKQTAVFNYRQAQQIYNHIATMFSKDVKIAPLEDYFPELFLEDRESKEDSTLQTQLHKAQFEEFAYWHNQRRKERASE